MAKREALARRYGAINDAQNALTRLMYEVCPRCAGNEPMFCEVVNGVHQHMEGVCEASVVRELKTHVDDVRDQFANEFNEKQEPRAIWGITSIPELENRNGGPSRVV
jgi:hypothetical protein